MFHNRYLAFAEDVAVSVIQILFVAVAVILVLKSPLGAKISQFVAVVGVEETLKTRAMRKQRHMDYLAKRRRVLDTAEGIDV